MTVVYRKFEQEIDLWGKIQEANNSINTIDVKGKNYAEVNQRVKAFRYVYPRGKITTHIELTGEEGKRLCYAVADVFDDLGNHLADGHAEEKEGSTFINKTSFIENAQTSAIGRALGFAGFGIDVSIASYEEVTNAMENQSGKKPTVTKISYFANLYSVEERQKIREHYKVNDDEELPREVVDKYVKDRKDKLKEINEQKDKEFRTLPDLKSEENPFY